MSKRCAIQAVTFDVGGTLIEPWPSVGHVYAETASRHGFAGIDVALLNRRFAEAWRNRCEFDYSKGAWFEIVEQTFRGTHPQLAAVSFFEPLYDRFAQAGAWRVFEDVPPILDFCRAKGIPLGIISNWDERLEPLLADLGLSGYFSVIVSSNEARLCKPAPRIFQEAATRLDQPPEAILHVGDSRREDRDGAERAGFQWRLIERGRRGTGEQTMSSLNELRAEICRQANTPG